MRGLSPGFTAFLYALVAVPLAVALGVLVEGARLGFDSSTGDSGWWVLAGVRLGLKLAILLVPLAAVRGYRLRTRELSSSELNGAEPIQP